MDLDEFRFHAQEMLYAGIIGPDICRTRGQDMSSHRHEQFRWKKWKSTRAVWQRPEGVTIKQFSPAQRTSRRHIKQQRLRNLTSPSLSPRHKCIPQNPCDGRMWITKHFEQAICGPLPI